jgi:hypothetical protein
MDQVLRRGLIEFLGGGTQGLISGFLVPDRDGAADFLHGPPERRALRSIPETAAAAFSQLFLGAGCIRHIRLY